MANFVTSRKLPDFLRLDEVELLIGSIKLKHRKDEELVICLGFCFYCGCRISEALSMLVSDVDFHGRDVLIRHGKGNKERLLPIPLPFLSVLKRFILKYNLSDSDRLVNFTRQNAWQRLQKLSLEILDKPAHPHTLRHSYATALYGSGVQLERLADNLGHTRLEVTRIYAKVSTVQRKNTIRIFENKFRLFWHNLTNTNQKKKELKHKLAGLFEREADTLYIEQKIKNGFSVLVFGDPGIGKTKLIKKIYNSIDGKKVWLNELRTNDDWVNMAKTVFSLDTNKLKFQEAFDLLQNEEFLLFMDDATNITALQLRRLQRLHCVVVAGSRKKEILLNFKTNILELKELSFTYAKELLQSLSDFDNKDVNRLFESSGGNPGRLIENAERFTKLGEMNRYSKEINITLVFVIALFIWLITITKYSLLLLLFSLLWFIIRRTLFKKAAL